MNIFKKMSDHQKNISTEMSAKESLMLIIIINCCCLIGILSGKTNSFVFINAKEYFSALLNKREALFNIAIFIFIIIPLHEKARKVIYDWGQRKKGFSWMNKSFHFKGKQSPSIKNMVMFLIISLGLSFGRANILSIIISMTLTRIASKSNSFMHSTMVTIFTLIPVLLFGLSENVILSIIYEIGSILALLFLLYSSLLTKQKKTV